MLRAAVRCVCSFFNAVLSSCIQHRMTNSPRAGVLHLPDITVIRPAFHPSSKDIILFNASRGHRMDISEILPGLRPPISASLFEEGTEIVSFQIVGDGVFECFMDEYGLETTQVLQLPPSHHRWYSDAHCAPDLAWAERELLARVGLRFVLATGMAQLTCVLAMNQGQQLEVLPAEKMSQYKQLGGQGNKSRMFSRLRTWLGLSANVGPDQQPSLQRGQVPLPPWNGAYNPYQQVAIWPPSATAYHPYYQGPGPGYPPSVGDQHLGQQFPPFVHYPFPHPSTQAISYPPHTPNGPPTEAQRHSMPDGLGRPLYGPQQPPDILARPPYHQILPEPPIPIAARAPGKEMAEAPTKEGQALTAKAMVPEVEESMATRIERDVDREVLLDEQPKGWKGGKWVWRSQGNTNHEGRFAEQRVCFGVIVCRGCQRPTRPRTQKDARIKQLDAACHGCGKYALEHVQCSAVAFHFTRSDPDGTNWAVWHHRGKHKHVRPPGGPISTLEEQAIDHQVQRRPDASAHQLRTGDDTPGSQALHTINPALANPRAARYRVASSRDRLGVHPQSSRGGFTFLSAVRDLCKKFNEPFLIDSSLGEVTYFVLQHPFMDKMLKEAVINWLDDTEGHSPDAGRHGFVTDGDNSFFRSGVLLTTCAWNPLMNGWVPVLYCWILNLDIFHHRQLFRHLNSSIVKHAGHRFTKKLLSAVMDFSTSQRGAHAHEYVNTMTGLNATFQELSPEAQKAEQEHLFQEASEYEKGCERHFLNSGSRMKKISAAIAPDKVETFDRCIHTMLSSSTTAVEFDDTVHELRETFPRITKWLDWWLRPSVAKMIFPVRRVMASELSSEMPATSNPVETQHFLLHHATGSDQDMIPGIEKIYKHVNGHYTPTVRRSPTNRGGTKYNPNDGRAPDTLETLGFFDAEMEHESQLEDEKLASRASGTLSKALEHRLAQQSYLWVSPNSCFIDHALELWWRCFCQWSPAEVEIFLDNIPKASAVASIFYHFKRRQTLLSDRSLTTDIDLQRELSLGQGVLLHTVLDVWKLVAKDGHGSPSAWMDHAVQPSQRIRSDMYMEYFKVIHDVTRECRGQHWHLETFSAPLALPLTLRNREAARKAISDCRPVTLGDYFEHFIPVTQKHVDRLGGVTFLHNALPRHCETEGCQEVAMPTTVRTTWPKMLHIVPEIRGLTEDALNAVDPVKFEDYFHIYSDDGSNESIDYELVGRVLHDPRKQHFIAQTLFQGSMYQYDDMHHKGQWVSVRPSESILSPDTNIAFYVYHRTSILRETVQRIGDIKSRFDSVSSLFPKQVLNLTSGSADGPTLSATAHQSREVTPVEIPGANVLTPTYSTASSSSASIVDCVVCVYPRMRHQESAEMVKCSNCQRWMHVNCVDMADALTEEYNLADSPWYCPDCLTSLIWRETFVGESILWPFREEGHVKYYPVTILGRDDDFVELEWSKCNVYAPGGPPPQQRFQAPEEIVVNMIVHKGAQSFTESFMHDIP
ncbi:hypothetical protein GLOTRDRAFT_122355 [Gloeophyllum trabeum ATCC 11539]|uniref:PHD-type domain-containing protein n=1 Tax=Gloeophyllum trabeum (strain ATCC 11539 / FP-39264 / Madison 617) TaxID=670483 RepID=S7PZG2_GLOTA|nr:uncharacterized protein GLOTRDRAFT_122355 [Gloeophyllum trabeum ATCC 11539]EPQ53046.1 hypothetical protein GLOTRDRAFT_122355 [Gloeophyllum trabeum ATCC 11539]